MSRSPAVKEKDSEVRRVETSESETWILPAVDLTETPSELTAVLDMPGVPRDGVEVDFEDRILTVRGRVSRRTTNDRASLWRESHRGHYARAFRVRGEIDAEKISAEYEDGVVTVRLPRREAAGPRKISIDTK